MIRRILRWFSRSIYCQVCGESFHWFDRKRKKCKACHRFTCYDCIEDLKEKELNKCLNCGELFESKKEYFEPEETTDDFIFGGIDGEIVNEPILGRIIGGAGHTDIDTLASPARTLTIPDGNISRGVPWGNTSYNEQARACVTIENNTIEPIDIRLNYHQNHTPIYGLRGAERIVQSGPMEVSGEMTILVDDVQMGALINPDGSCFTVRHGDQVIENCIIEEVDQEIREGELATATIRFRGVPSGA